MLCNICPRRCGAERTETRGGGVCAMPAGIVAAKAMLHQWEEPVLSGTNGAGCVFFSGCNLGCVFCQNGFAHALHALGAGGSGRSTARAGGVEQRRL